MKAKTTLFLLIIAIVFTTACAISDGNQNPNANVTREEAVQTIKDISKGTGDADIKSYPDRDQIENDVRYYYVEVVFANKMGAAYFVDENEGQVFVAFGGEVDTSNPLPNLDVSEPEASAQGSADKSGVADINAEPSSAIKDIFDIIGKTSEQVEQKFGGSYKKVSMNYDGLMEGFFYSDLGLTAAFGSDGAVAFVYCTDKIDINGARSGMDFSQIQEKLGETVLNQKWADTPINAAFEIKYNFDGRTVVFFSQHKDGDNCIMSIS